MYSVSKIQLTPELARPIVRRHFGPDRRLKSFTEMNEGLYNAAALLELEDGLRCVLKAAPRPDVRVLRYEKDILRAEVEAMRLVGERTQVPVPPIYGYDTARDLLPSDYYLMAFLPGQPFHKLRPELAPEVQAGVDREMGRMAREMSAITNSAFGYWSQPEAPGVSWRDCFANMVRGVLQDGLDAGVALPLPYDEIDRRLAAHYDALEEVTVPRLVHWDLWDGNVFVDPPTGRVTGLIDFERTLWGDPLIEVIFMNLDPDSPAAQGFGADVLRAETERRRRLLYNAYLFLIMIIETFYRSYDNDWQINWATGKFLETMAQL